MRNVEYPVTCVPANEGSPSGHPPEPDRQGSEWSQRWDERIGLLLGESPPAGHARTRFIAVVSHALRTPLAPVLACLELMQRQSDLTPQMREDLETVRRNVEMEARVIEELLQRLDAASGERQLSFEPFLLLGGPGPARQP